MTDKYPVVEIFGPTVQGEGALAGTVSHFIRFGGCDFRCAWCDSSHAVLPEFVRQSKRLTVDQIMYEVNKRGEAQWVTLSGGNPALQKLGTLVDRLHEHHFKVAIETQGSAWWAWLAKLDLLTVSPKPPSSGMDNKRLGSFLSMVDQFKVSRKAVLKVPVFDERDYQFAADMHNRYPTYRFYLSVVTRMGGLLGTFEGGTVDTTDDLLKRYKWLVERALRDSSMSDVSIFPQLHVLVWGHARGH